MKKRETIGEMEKRDAAGYARIPSQPGEFDEWESEQVWLEDARALREAINSGERTFAELRKVLSSAAEFRNRLKNQEPDQELVKAYFREVTKTSWVDKLPTKSVRWSIFTGLGLVVDALGGSGLGTASAVAVSAADAFLLDRLLKGWKPNQFVDDSLKKFSATNNLK